MGCSNTETYHVERHFGVVQIEVSCGSTDPYGNRCLCEKCRKDPIKRAEHDRLLRVAEADNSWLRSAGWGDI